MANLTTQQKKTNATLQVPMWIDILLQNGVNPDVIPNIISQIVFESNWFSSNAYKIDHNPSGITWNSNYMSRPGTSVGISRRSSEGGNYVHFDTYKTAAKDLIRILSKKSSAGAPIDAADAIEFSKRLKANGYYTSPLSEYAAGIKSIRNKLDEWTNVTAAAKKKSSLNMAGLPVIFMAIIIGTLIFRK